MRVPKFIRDNEMRIRLEEANREHRKKYMADMQEYFEANIPEGTEITLEFGEDPLEIVGGSLIKDGADHRFGRPFVRELTSMNIKDKFMKLVTKNCDE